MKLCQVKTVSHHIVLTRCGRTVRMDEATCWASDVACPDCLNGHTVNEVAALADMHAATAT